MTDYVDTGRKGDSTTVTATTDGRRTTIHVSGYVETLQPTNNLRWLRKGWFRKELQQAFLSSSGALYWSDVRTVGHQHEA